MKKIICYLGILGGMLISPAAAMQFQSEEKLNVERNEMIIENWYGLGETVNFYGHALQDVWILGSRVSAWGKVERDLTVAGLDVEIRGRVGEDLRVVAGEIDVSAIVLKSALLVANQVQVKNGAIIQGELVLSGQRIVVGGNIEGPVHAYGKNVMIEGMLAGDLVVKADTITLGPRAKILGNVQYTAPKQMHIDPGAYIQGTVNWQANEVAPTSQAWPFGMQTWLFTGKIFYRLTLFLGMLILGVLLIWLLPQPARRYTLVIKHKPGPSLGWGFLTFVSIPIFILIFLITIMGIPLAVVLTIFFLAGLILAHLGVGYLLGLMLLRFDFTRLGRQIGAFCLGFTLLSLLILIPYLGMIIQIFAFMLGLGAIWLTRNFVEPQPALVEEKAPPAAIPLSSQPLSATPTTGEHSVIAESKATPSATHLVPKREWKPEVPAFRQTSRGRKKATSTKRHVSVARQKASTRSKQVQPGQAKKNKTGMRKLKKKKR